MFGGLVRSAFLVADLASHENHYHPAFTIGASSHGLPRAGSDALTPRASGCSQAKTTSVNDKVASPR
jgi:hypothetical protein